MFQEGVLCLLLLSFCFATAAPMRYIISLTSSSTEADLRSLVAFIRQNSGTVIHEYHSALLGVAAELPADLLQRVLEQPKVEAVEQDRPVSAQLPKAKDL